MKTKNQPRKSRKRAAVLAAATEEFLSRGFAETSMDRIAEVADVSKRTVYNHFPSKEVLFRAIVEEIFARIEEIPRHEYSSEAPLDAQLYAIGEAFAQAITDKNFMKLSRIAISRSMLVPALAKTTLVAHAGLRRDMIAFFKGGNADKRLRVPDLDMAASQFCGLMKEIVYWPDLMAGQDPITPRARKAAVKSAAGIFLSYYAIECLVAAAMYAREHRAARSGSRRRPAGFAPGIAHQRTSLFADRSPEVGWESACCLGRNPLCSDTETPYKE